MSISITVNIEMCNIGESGVTLSTFYLCGPQFQGKRGRSAKFLTYICDVPYKLELNC